MQIENYIPVGRENAIRRDALCTITGLPDRENRRWIREARRRGVPICRGSKGGYFVAADDAELNALLSDMYARATDLMDTARQLQRLHRSSRQFGMDGGVRNG